MNYGIYMNKRLYVLVITRFSSAQTTYQMLRSYFTFFKVFDKTFRLPYCFKRLTRLLCPLYVPKNQVWLGISPPPEVNPGRVKHPITTRPVRGFSRLDEKKSSCISEALCRLFHETARIPVSYTHLTLPTILLV